jgi:hypothetical protein
MRGSNRATGSRVLTELERTVTDAIPVRVDLSRVRLYQDDCRGAAGWLRRLVLGASRNRAVALGNHVFLPDRCQNDPAVLVHELTHCGQYQAWGPAIYFARGIAAQTRELLYRRLGVGSSPYLYQVKASRPFESYGMEQQAQMAEDRFRRSAASHVMPSA